jgi:dolichyl-phosphate-mannose-protein mannosyltransferase
MTLVTTRLAELLRRSGGWPATLAVVGLAALLRLPALDRPGTLVFDETYYVKDSWTLLNLGYEAEWPDDVDAAFAAGDVDGYLQERSYVVHPQVGKWVIALGMRLLGADNAVGWRIGAAIAGIITVLLVTRLARRLFDSTALGVVAGCLVALDGSAIAQSRTSLLDGILTMWLVAGFAALLVDRDWARARLDRLTAPPRRAGRFGPGLGLRPFRILAGVLMGLAAGTKWSALWFLAVFGLLTVAWDASARYRAGVRLWWQGALLRDAGPAALSLVGVAVLTYVGSWWSWFTHEGSYGRQWAASYPDSWVPDALRSWWHYHGQMWRFHTGLEADHPYLANPVGWLLQIRPTVFYYESPEPAEQMCGASHCSETVTSLGNPFIWWLGAAAVVAAVVWALLRRDQIAAACLTGVAAGWLPWLAFPDRPVFTFYAVAFQPWLALTLTWAVARLVAWARPDQVRWRYLVTALVVVAVLVVAATVFFLPVWTADVMPYEKWQLRQWLPSWV